MEGVFALGVDVLAIFSINLNQDRNFGFFKDGEGCGYLVCHIKTAVLWSFQNGILGLMLVLICGYSDTASRHR
jgi:hypothetical protein